MKVPEQLFSVLVAEGFLDLLTLPVPLFLDGMEAHLHTSCTPGAYTHVKGTLRASPSPICASCLEDEVSDFSRILALVLAANSLRVPDSFSEDALSDAAVSLRNFRRYARLDPVADPELEALRPHVVSLLSERVAALEGFLRTPAVKEEALRRSLVSYAPGRIRDRTLLHRVWRRSPELLSFWSEAVRLGLSWPEVASRVHSCLTDPSEDLDPILSALREAFEEIISQECTTLVSISAWGHVALDTSLLLEAFALRAVDSSYLLLLPPSALDVLMGSGVSGLSKAELPAASPHVLEIVSGLWDPSEEGPLSRLTALVSAASALATP